MADIDPRILALCEKVTALRPKRVIKHIIEYGQITTEELKEEYGYNHPPRAARDVREAGIPLDTIRVPDRTGRMIAAYRFGDPAKIKRGRIGGRKAFSKRFKEALVQKYGEADAITGEQMDARYLQIDHRVPYEVAGDEIHDEQNLDEYMLLDASSQRSKSWSCEACPNWMEFHEVHTCRTCFWANPENYTHIAMEAVRRADIEWRGEETEYYDKLKARADGEGITLAALIKRLTS